MKERRNEIEARKTAIKRRLNIAKYSDPKTIVYSEENDHNPWVLEKCPACSGTGKNCQYVAAEITYKTDFCSTCNGRRYTGEIVRQFADNSAPMTVSVNPQGWVKCPGCGIGFKVTSIDSWSGRRHLSCGQKIILCDNAPT